MKDIISQKEALDLMRDPKVPQQAKQIYYVSNLAGQLRPEHPATFNRQYPPCYWCQYGDSVTKRFTASDGKLKGALLASCFNAVADLPWLPLPKGYPDQIAKDLSYPLLFSPHLIAWEKFTKGRCPHFRKRRVGSIGAATLTST